MGKTREARTAGRPRGRRSTRAEIVTAAARAFATDGYDATSVRGIATEAGVDPSTVTHFFGSKEGVFREVVGELAPAAQPLLDAVTGGAPGRDIVERYLDVWTDPASGVAMRALLRSAVASEPARKVLRAGLLDDLYSAFGAREALGGPLALTHLFGLALGMFIGEVAALSDADREEVVARVGRTLDEYLSS